jgi:hypothetical protein
LVFLTVPKGKNRVRVTLHAGNTEAEVEGMIAAICEWTQEMLLMEQSTGGEQIPKAARQLYVWLNSEITEHMHDYENERGYLDFGGKAKQIHSPTQPSSGDTTHLPVTRESDQMYETESIPETENMHESAETLPTERTIEKTANTDQPLMDVIRIQETPKEGQIKQLGKRHLVVLRIRDRLRH